MAAVVEGGRSRAVVAMTTAGARAEVLSRVADRVVATVLSHPTRVAVDGITAAGKTTFARELVDAIAARGRSALHLSTNGFHHRSAHRHRDPDAAAGYYRDAFDLARFRALVLDPLGPGGDLRYRARSHDLATDELVDDEPISAAADAVLVVDGTFLQCAALTGAWDEVIWLDVEQAAAVDGDPVRARPDLNAQDHAFGRDRPRRVRGMRMLIRRRQGPVAVDDLDRG